MAQYGNMYGGGGFAGYSPQEQALSYGQQRYMRGRPSLTQQAELMGGYAVPLYAAQEQKKEQKSYMDIEKAWYDKQASMFEEQMKMYKDQFAKGQISEQEMFSQTSALEKQLSEQRMQMERGIAERQLQQQKTQGAIGMGLQAAQTGMQAYQVGQSAGWWGNKPATPSFTPGYAAGGYGTVGLTGGAGGTGYAAGGYGTVSALEGGAGVGLGTYAGYAGIGVGGYMGGKSAKEQYEAGEISRKGSRAKSVMSGATAGAIAGSVIPGIGTGIGAVVGGISGLIGSCIIVSSCTDPDSYEVNITREFRDKHLDPVTLKGYYRLASCIVPLIKASEQFKRYIKETLVNRLIDYGEWFMGYKTRLKFNDSEYVARNFLNTCYLMGA